MTINKIKRTVVMCWCLLVGTSLTTMAQTDFNPVNPPEPQQQYKVIVKAEPANVAYTSGGGGFVEGYTTRISSSSQSTSYHFQYWTKNGSRFEGDTQPSFNHVVTKDKVTYVAHYFYRPEDPKEPTLNAKYRIYVKSQPEGCCSFNITNGQKTSVGTSQYLSYNANAGYKFQGWFEEANKISSSSSFYYEMPNHNVNLVAKFVYSPDNPGEPNADPNKPQDDVQNQKRGDINGDGKITVADAVSIVNAYLSGQTQKYPLGIYDVNNDGTISVSDAVKIVNIYLGL